MSAGDAAFDAARRLFLDGVAAHEAGDAARAEALFEASLAQLPGRPSTLINLAAARLARGRAADALAPLAQALAQVPADAQAWALQGQALAQAGRGDEALASFERALALAPDDRAALYHRGMLLNALHRPQDALADFERLCALDPRSADAQLRRGQTLQRLHRLSEALAALDAALAVRANDAVAWNQRGTVLAQLGRVADAAASLRQALAHGADAEVTGWYLASLEGRAHDSAPPRAYVQALFDDYAADFEQHLVGALGYRGHAAIAEQLARVAPPPRRFSLALDLGCGSGLLGTLLRRRCARLVGIDLSARMLAQARARGDYDELLQADVIEHLQRTPAGSHDLVVAGDLFIYFGRLEAVFDAVQHVLAPGGLFAFTLEAAGDEVDVIAGDALRGTRSRHSARYVRALAAARGYTLRELAAQPLRREQQQDVAGLIVSLEAGAHRPPG
jgi:predicted TPR repeat methyltransferase